MKHWQTPMPRMSLKYILTREPSIAVFPFKNLTGDPDKEYIAYGLSEELSLELTKYEDLKIINCWHRPDFATSENAYEKIGARYVIDGSVQAYDERLHILVKVSRYTLQIHKPGQSVTAAT
jgi:TolB-like protein